jgi:L-threonylcarbamoyladenylate synthase
MRQHAKIGISLAEAIDCLNASDVVGIPTETVYGLAGNALNERAVSRIFTVKNRPTFDPLIVHIHSIEQAAPLVQHIPEAAKKLAEAFWPGPLTLLLPRTVLIPDLVTAGSDRVALRVPNHPLTLELLRQLPYPLAAPSANPFGYISPTMATHVAQQLGNEVCYILDGGPCQIGIESTIVGFEEGKTIVYRLGGIALEQLEQVAGPLSVLPHSSSNPQAPGMLQSHYAPRKPMILGDIDKLLQQYNANEVAILAFKTPHAQVPVKQQRLLSVQGDMEEAARNLFAAMRQLDEQDVRFILAELVPDHGLGKAINDRLRRASVKV